MKRSLISRTKYKKRVSHRERNSSDYLKVVCLEEEKNAMFFFRYNTTIQKHFIFIISHKAGQFVKNNFNFGQVQYSEILKFLDLQHVI